MSEIVIDNQTYKFEGDHNLLQFIQDLGKEVPFFCYHPSMSIPANCRQCMVKVGQYVKDKETGKYERDENGEKQIRWFPKLQTSCNLKMSDDMVVHTQETDDLVKRAQKDNLEFILINHPLDCPICDQAGECPLQIQTYKYGPEGSRFEVEKIHKPKRVQLGPRVTLDAERCINCTRCTRFTEEISKTYQLTIISRGDKNYPATAPGETFDDPYSMNTIDICPVGALTSSDFRFRARVWEMNQTPSLDISNGKGSNIDLWTRDNLILRITPRHNEHINDHWIPDEARAVYTLFNENRVSRPLQKLDSEQILSSWSNAVATFTEQVSGAENEKILIIGSPHASVEENYVLGKYANLLGINRPIYAPDIKEGRGDDFLITDDRAPNTTGCKLLDLQETDEKSITQSVKNADLVIVLSDHLIDRGALSKEELKDKFVIVFATNHSDTTKAADLVVPVTCIAEHAASYINLDGRIQRSFPAKETKYTNRRLNLEMSEGRTDRYGTNFDNWRTEENKIDCLPVWKFMTQVAEQSGLDLAFKSGREIMREIAKTNEAFSGVSYSGMDDNAGIQLSIEGTKKTKA